MCSLFPRGAKLVSGAFQAGIFKLCQQSASAGQAHQIILNAVGRPRTQKINVEVCGQLEAHPCSAPNLIDQCTKLVNILKTAINAGKADVGYLVKLFQLAHYQFAQTGGGDFFQPQAQ